LRVDAAALYRTAFREKVDALKVDARSEVTCARRPIKV
jgi:hypothetical protein